MVGTHTFGTSYLVTVLLKCLLKGPVKNISDALGSVTKFHSISIVLEKSLLKRGSWFHWFCVEPHRG